MFERILVCLDGSKLAEQILPYAVVEAVRFEGKLVLFQAVPEPVAYSPGIPGTEPGAIQTDTMLEEARKALNEARDYLEGLAAPLRKKDISVEVVTVLGRAGEAIVTYAHDNKIKLITIATHGRSGVRRGVFGSVADYVLRESRLPMLVIRPQEEKGKA
jgi:nucleotide-binding universal stress UspA family protein